MFLWLYKFLFRYFTYFRITVDTQNIVNFFGKDSRFVDYMRHNNDLSYTDEQDNIVCFKFLDGEFRIKDLTFRGMDVFYKNNLIFGIIPNGNSVMISSCYLRCDGQEIYDLFSDIDAPKKLTGNIDLTDNISSTLILDDGFVQNGDCVVKCDTIEILSPDLDLHNFHADCVVLHCEYDISRLGKLPSVLRIAEDYQSENVQSYLGVPEIRIGCFNNPLISIIPEENDIQQIIVDQSLIFDCLILKKDSFGGNNTLYFNTKHPLFERYRNNEMKVKPICKKANSDNFIIPLSVQDCYFSNRNIRKSPIGGIRACT